MESTNSVEPFRKSTYSGGANNSCVEVGKPGRVVAIRDTTQAGQNGRTVVEISGPAWADFIDGLK